MNPSPFEMEMFLKKERRQTGNLGHIFLFSPMFLWGLEWFEFSRLENSPPAALWYTTTKTTTSRSSLVWEGFFFFSLVTVPKRKYHVARPP
jgi:hypothetical protein